MGRKKKSLFRWDRFLRPGAAPPAVPGGMTQLLWQFATGMTPSVYGVPGILSGAALVFFAFIGFDVVATASEETKNPHKNVPLGIGVGMLLIIVMYMLVAVVTTGMVSYADLAKQDSPSLATAFELVGADWAAKIISFGIVLGLATVVMVLLLGLTRIVFAMSRDGLLPRGLSKTGKHGTPVGSPHLTRQFQGKTQLTVEHFPAETGSAGPESSAWSGASFTTNPYIPDSRYTTFSA